MSSPENPYTKVVKDLEVEGQKFTYYDLASLGKDKLGKECLPFKFTYNIIEKFYSFMFGII